MIGFVVAMQKESELFLQKSNVEKVETFAGKKIYIGNFNDTKFVLIISGIGKVNASFSTQIIIDKYNVSTVINYGVAGGKRNSNLKAGDVVLISKVCQYDFDLSEIDNVKIGYMQDYDLIFYPTSYLKYKGKKFKLKKGASADRFTQNGKWLDIIAQLGGEVVDMESGAIVQTAYANNVDIYVLKLISDVDGEKESIFEQYSNNVKNICEKLPNAIEELLKNI